MAKQYSWLDLARLYGVTIAAVTILVFSGLDRSLNNWLSDSYSSWLSHNSHAPLTIVSIDAKSLEAMGTWPWNREVYAKALDELAQTDIQGLFIDIDFSTSSEREQDIKLWNAIDRFAQSKPLLLPAFLQQSHQNANSLSITKPEIETNNNIQLVSVNIKPGNDSLVRAVESGFIFAGQQYLTAGAVLASAAGQHTQIDFSINPRSFNYLSFIDLIEGRYDKTLLDGHRVLIGATAIELGDNIAVPVYGSLPGVVVQAIIAETFRQGALNPSKRFFETVSTLCLLGLVSLLIVNRKLKNALLLSCAILLASQFAGIASQFVFRVPPNFALPLLFFSALIFSLLTNKINKGTLEVLQLKLSLLSKSSIIDAVFEHSNDNIICIDKQHNITQVSSSMAELLSTKATELIGLPISRFLPMFEDIPEISVTEKVDTYSNDNTQLEPGQGEPIPVELSINPVQLGADVSYAIIIRDRRKQIKREQELRHQTLHDKLTGLPNRKYLLEKIRKSIANDDPLTIAHIDIGFFKEVNDHYGHTFGDEILICLASTIRNTISDKGLCFRLDGAEFAVLLTGSLSRGEVKALVQDIHQGASRPINIDGYTVELGLHIGVACLEDAHNDSVELLRHADMALQRSKANRSVYASFDSSLYNTNHRFIELLPKLREAIASNQLMPVFQPKISLVDNTPSGCEMLLRWSDDNGNPISPDVFINVAENSQLIAPLTINNIQQVLDLEALWIQHKLPNQVAINLSARLLSNTRLIDDLISLAKSSMGYIQIEFEITETALMVNQSIATKSAASLREAGFKISIDDYGTGYSSLSYIRDLGAHTIKIDKSFVDNIETDENSRTILKSTVKMAQELTLTTVAEGIENNQQAAFLKNIGCDVGQGYRFGKPMPIKEYIHWCASQSGNLPPEELGQTA